MSTIAADSGWFLRVYPNDHPPPHAHAHRQGKVGDVRIVIDGASPALMNSHDSYSTADVRFALALAAQHHVACLEKWRSYHAQA